MSAKQRSVQYSILNIYFAVFLWFWLIIVSLSTFLFWLFRVKQIKRLISKRRGKKISVLYLEVFSPLGAGNKYRTSKWVEILSENGFKANSKYVFEYNEYLHLTSFKEGVVMFLIGFLWKRWWQCLSSLSYDIVIVRRELLMFNDYGNLFFERLIYNMHSHLVLDFDDDIAAAKNEPREISFYGKLLLEHPRKFSASFRFFNGFFVGSNYLKERLMETRRDVNEKDILNVPTCVDYDKYPPKSYSNLSEEINIGWVGAQNNLKNVPLVLPALNILSAKYRFKLLIICDKPLVAQSPFPIIHIPWSAEREIENLKLIDIGIMPLINNEQSKGKAAFKLIQYMGCGIVSMATALTINKEVIDESVNGFLVEPDGDWVAAFEKVFKQREHFQEIGKKAYQKITVNYSFSSHQQQYMKFLKEMIHPISEQNKNI